MPERVWDLALLGDGGFAGRVYDEILIPAFPPDELDDRVTFVDGVLAGEGVMALALADEPASAGGAGGSGDRPGPPLAAIAGYRYPESRVLLLGYLAVRSDLRSMGLGAALLEAAGRRWYSPEWCDLVLAEVEDPRFPARPGSDPRRRLAFYRRNGALLLRRPYFQPSLRPGLARVWGMLLIALWCSPQVTVPGGLPSAPVTSFLERYFEESEGPPDSGDGSLMALLAAYRSAPLIELVGLDQYDSVAQIGPPAPLSGG